MNKFKIGDKVTVKSVADPSGMKSLIGKYGMIFHIDYTSADALYLIEFPMFPNKVIEPFWAEELELK